MAKAKVEEATAKQFTLPHKTVRVLPVLRDGSWLPEGHDGEFLYTGASYRIPVPMSRQTGKLINPLNEEETAHLEDLMSMNKGGLSIYKPKKENFWARFEVKITKDGLVLDLQDPEQYIAYKVLLVNSELVAPSFEKRYSRGGYKFMLVDEDHEIQSELSKADLMESVWMEFGAIRNSDNKLKNVLRMYHDRPVSKSSKSDFLITEVKKIIDNDPNGFIRILTDENFEMKCFIEDALVAGAITKPAKNRYTFTGTPEEVYTLDQLITELDPNGVNQDKYLLIKTQIEESE